MFSVSGDDNGDIAEVRSVLIGCRFTADSARCSAQYLCGRSSLNAAAAKRSSSRSRRSCLPRTSPHRYHLFRSLLLLIFEYQLHVVCVRLMKSDGKDIREDVIHWTAAFRAHAAGPPHGQGAFLFLLSCPLFFPLSHTSLASSDSDQF